MDYEINVTTPGNKLSLKTMLGGIANDLSQDIERGTFDMLKSEFPKVSNKTLGKYIFDESDLYLKDIRKGSWEIALIGTVGGVIGKVMYDLAIDYVKTSTQWEEFKNRTRSPSKVAAQNISSRIQKRKKFGPFEVYKRKVTIEQSSNGVSKLSVEIVLKRKHDQEIAVTTESQINEMIRQIESGEYKDKNTSNK